MSPPEFLKTISIGNFRNIAELKLSLGTGHNLFVGPNGHGKTNCLEAIALALSLKSMHNFNNADLITHEASQSSILATWEGAYSVDIAVEILPRGKKVLLNNQSIKNASALRKLVSLVSFIPEELDLVTGTSALRRRALDQASSALYFEHANSIRSYERALLHRNSLLKGWPLDTTTLKAFTELLIKEGAHLIHYRQKAIEQLDDIFEEKARQILGHTISARMQYCTKDRALRHQTIGDLMGLLEEQYGAVRSTEPHRKSTLFGPHLDDIVFQVDGYPAKKSVSRGQSRALVLAFKLAHMLAIKAQRGIAPVIILDDIVSELDAEKRDNLVQIVLDLKTQSFFSATDLAIFGGTILDGNIFQIKGGALLRHIL